MDSTLIMIHWWNIEVAFPLTFSSLCYWKLLNSIRVKEGQHTRSEKEILYVYKNIKTGNNVGYNGWWKLRSVFVSFPPLSAVCSPKMLVRLVHPRPLFRFSPIRHVNSSSSINALIWLELTWLSPALSLSLYSYYYFYYYLYCHYYLYYYHLYDNYCFYH